MLLISNGTVHCMLPLPEKKYADQITKMVKNSSIMVLDHTPVDDFYPRIKDHSKIIYIHPHPEKSDKDLIRLVNVLRKNNSKIELVVFSESRCIDFASTILYIHAEFTNSLHGLAKHMSQ